MTSKAAQDVLAERQRQIDVEGFTQDHDEAHADGELAMAAICYADPDSVIIDQSSPSDIGIFFWPWEWHDWKPKSYRENLVRAGALIIAEIERLDRQ